MYEQSFSSLMRSGDRLTTVIVVWRDNFAEDRSRDSPPEEFGEHAPLAIAGLAVCVTLALVTLTPVGHYRLENHFALVLFVCVPVLLLRRWPLSVFAIVVAGTGLVIASGNLVFPIALVLGVSMFVVASYTPRRRSIPAAVAAGSALGGALLFAALELRNPNLTVDALEGYLPLLAAWFVGDSAAARRRYVAGLAAQADRERAAESERSRLEVREERVRIARELHDVVAHTLAVITVQAGVGRRLMAKRPEEASIALESIEMIGRTAQEELRVVLDLLRDDETRAAALAPAPGLVDLPTLVETVRASGTPIDFHAPEAPIRLSPALELSIYRVVQEALTNVVKHSPGAATTVDLTVAGNEIHVAVTDHGSPQGSSGPNTAALCDMETGHGIVGMRERVGAFGGRLITEPVAPGGFRVYASIPIGELS